MKSKQARKIQRAATFNIQFPAGRHLIWLPIVLSLAIAGAGQFYNRRYLKAVFSLVLVILAFEFLNRLGVLFITFYGVADARAIAIRLRHGQSVGKWQFF